MHTIDGTKQPDAAAELMAENAAGCPPVSPVAPTALARPQPRPYGDEPPDYKTYRYGYPPCCGRMFGSGN
jgi:hypothetical protein